MAVTGCASEQEPTTDTAPTWSPSPSASPSDYVPPAPPPLPETTLVIGPEGAGPLRLGMSAAEVEATGVARTFEFSVDGYATGCWVVDYRPRALGRTPGDTLAGYIDPRRGVESLHATRRMATPEGIQIGSSIEDVEQAYDRRNLGIGDQVRVAASPRSYYRIQLAGVVTSISLERFHTSCGL